MVHRVPVRPGTAAVESAHATHPLLVHCVFSAKERRGLILQQLQPCLWAYIGGIADKSGFMANAVDGTEDHAHVLLGVTAHMPVAKAVQLIKAGSSKWLREQKGLRGFGWQEAYSAFTIGASQLAKTVWHVQTSPHTTRRDHSRRNIGPCCALTTWCTRSNTCSDDPVSRPWRDWHSSSIGYPALTCRATFIRP